MTREMISAHHRAAAAFNDIVSAARIAIEALAKIAAESGRQSRSSRIHLLKSKSLSAFRNRLSGSVRPRRVAILPERPPRNPHRAHRQIAIIAAARAAAAFYRLWRY